MISVKNTVKRVFLSMLFMTGCTAPIYSQLIITTVAGTGVDGHSGDGGPAVAARLSGPGFVAVDASDNFYISEYSQHLIRKVNSAGIISTFAGSDSAGYTGDGGPATAARLNIPAGIACDNAGNLFIADEFNHAIRKVDAAGIISTIAGTGTAGFSGDNGAATAAELNRPFDVAVDRSGNVYCSDHYNGVIRRISPSGIITTVAGTPGLGGYTGNDGPATAARIGQVIGMGIDGSDNLYIAESSPQNIIRKIDNSGIISLVAGDTSTTFTGDGMPATATRLQGPADITFDTAGNLYFSEQTRNTVRKIENDGKLSTYAGNGFGGFGGDGGAPVYATLGGPIGLAFDKSNNLLIADIDNSRIRKVGTTPVAVPVYANETQQWYLYPNPTSGVFRIAGITANETAFVKVTDPLGRTVKEITMKAAADEAIIVLPPSLAVGIYIVTITTEDFTKNFTIQVIH